MGVGSGKELRTPQIVFILFYSLNRICVSFSLSVFFFFFLRNEGCIHVCVSPWMEKDTIPFLRSSPELVVPTF